MNHRSFRLENKDFDRIYGGSNVFEIEIHSKQKSKKGISLLVSGDVLLRVEKKPRNRREASFINDPFVRAVVQSKKLIGKDARAHLKRIILLDKEIKESLNNEISQSYRYDNLSDFAGYYKSLEGRWEEMTTLQNKVGLSLLRKDSFGFCGQCHGLRGAPEIPIKGSKPEPQTCTVCSKPINKRKIIQSLPDPIASYIDGIWLEDYVAERLKKLGWRVWPHIYIYGNSGVKHEIDILAIKNGYSLLVECKTGSEQKGLPTFLAKFYDIRTHHALYVSTQKADDLVRGMVKKNPAFRLLDDISGEQQLLRGLKSLTNQLK